MNDLRLNNLPQSDPANVLRFRDRQYAADLIGAAIIEFDFFSWLQDNPRSSLSVICEHFDWHARPADVLLTLCRASGFITSEEICDGNYRADDSGLSSLSIVGQEHLTSTSPWFLGPYYQPIADSKILKDFASILRTGKPANWQAKSDGADWHESMKDPQFARSFTGLMNCRGLALGQHLAKSLIPKLSESKHLLDVAGGSGIYSATMVAHNPHLRATVWEQAPVDAIVRSEIERYGLSEKVSIFSGDMFSNDWQTSLSNAPAMDVVLMSNVLHDWDWPEAQSLINKAYALLPPKGTLVIHDAIINAEKAGPLAVAEYSALLMNITQGKCYSVGEYNSMLANAGFQPAEFQSTIADRGFMTAIK
ncbi:Demethylspheroidene O-methyltransferase [Roseimaritima multifibrata]|uniref:Demethylspheroidene O-methyltransferase n=1 Tax=Roseimaritima multifibrata TaxID=1930274 RepID=A0A517MLY2_9BACT|nr:methyltransferase [Roseimaritima multifibrata]QDS95905.1 Demethylspheroidene O-methyltransferase [Roseimaritima multifibrata]